MRHNFLKRFLHLARIDYYNRASTVSFQCRRVVSFWTNGITKITFNIIKLFLSATQRHYNPFKGIHNTETDMVLVKVNAQVCSSLSMVASALSKIRRPAYVMEFFAASSYYKSSVDTTLADFWLVRYLANREQFCLLNFKTLNSHYTIPYMASIGMQGCAVNLN